LERRSRCWRPRWRCRSRYLPFFVFLFLLLFFDIFILLSWCVEQVCVPTGAIGILRMPFRMLLKPWVWLTIGSKSLRYVRRNLSWLSSVLLSQIWYLPKIIPAGQTRGDGQPQCGWTVHDDLPVAVPKCQTATQRPTPP
jgi:hypothetical protein